MIIWVSSSETGFQNGNTKAVPVPEEREQKERKREMKHEKMQILVDPNLSSG